MKEPKRQNGIKLLSADFRLKFDPRRKEVIALYPNARVFETLRTKERQERLYSIGRTQVLDRKPITRTLKSAHLLWDAVDVVFNDTKWNPTRNWPYDQLITLAKRYGIKNLKPRETCHFEDDGTPYKKQYSLEEMASIRKTLECNSWMYHFTDDNDLKQQLNDTNNMIREIYQLNQ